MWTILVLSISARNSEYWPRFTVLRGEAQKTVKGYITATPQYGSALRCYFGVFSDMDTPESGRSGSIE